MLSLLLLFNVYVTFLYFIFSHALTLNILALAHNIFTASNTFFLQFPNCLAYKNKKGCVEKIKFALENDPVPLSQEDRHKLTWEGANTRLFESSLMTEAEAEERNKKTCDFARLHMDTMKTGAFFQGLWSRGTYKKTTKEVKQEEKETICSTTNTQEKTLLGICKV